MKKQRQPHHPMGLSEKPFWHDPNVSKSLRSVASRIIFNPAIRSLNFLFVESSVFGRIHMSWAKRNSNPFNTNAMKCNELNVLNFFGAFRSLKA